MSWVEGLLGAVMGGAQEYGTILKEEEAAKRKEEEEKRREERALSLKEREREMARKREEEIARLKAERIAGYLGPAGGATPSQSPMEPEGGGVTEYQIPAEQRLVRGQEAALAKGDVETAKLFNDQYRAIMQEQRAQAKEGREQDEFLRGPKPKEPVGEVAFAKYAAERTYRGPRDAEGKPDPVAFAEHEAGILNRMIEKKTQLRPERPTGVAGGERPPKPPTTADYGKARNTLQRDVERLSTVMKDNKIVRDPFLYEAINSVVSRELKKDKDRVFEAGLADEARTEVVSALESARAEVRRELEKTTGADGKPLSKDTLRRNREILANPVSLERYENENAKKYMSRYLGGEKAEEPKRGGKPWERSWGSME